MNAGQTVFSQFMEHLPSYEFQKCIERYRGDAHHRGFSCRDQFLAMAFAQLTYRESLRDIEACLPETTPSFTCRPQHHQDFARGGFHERTRPWVGA
jgi:hypothetical protein